MRPQESTRFEGRYLTLTTEEKDGKTFERAYVRNGVTVIVEPVPGTLRFAHGRSWKDPNAARGPLVISGHVEDGETALECAKRELLEELGATAADWEHYLTSRWDGTVIKIQEYFIARTLSQEEAHPEDGEDIEGYVDFTYAEAQKEILQLTFGTNENAFALLKYIFEAKK